MFIIIIIILCKINLAIAFVSVRSTISGFHCHFIASRYKRRSPEKDFQVKEFKDDSRSVCASLTSVFKTSGRKGQN